MPDLALVLFDVDGTLVDSRSHILGGMAHAFATVGLPLPPADHIMTGVGLSLPVFMRRLCPEVPEAQIEALVHHYKNAFVSMRSDGNKAALSPLFPGIAAALEACEAQDYWLLGVATGKSRRGLDHLIDLHGWHKRFLTRQCADNHPSKPHPSMVLAAMAETGVAPARCVVIGDTSYDMEMARAAGARGIGVSWGYHSAADLRAAGAVDVLMHAGEIPGVVAKLMGEANG